MKNQITIAITALLLSMAGCLPASKFTMENARKVKTGMKESEAIELLGEPTSINLTPMFAVLTWSYVNTFTGQYQVVTFYSKDGKIVSQQEITKEYTKEMLQGMPGGWPYGSGSGAQPSDTGKKQ